MDGNTAANLTNWPGTLWFNTCTSFTGNFHQEQEHLFQNSAPGPGRMRTITTKPNSLALAPPLATRTWHKSRTQQEQAFSFFSWQESKQEPVIFADC
jgi:hypothetical protein